MASLLTIDIAARLKPLTFALPRVEPTAAPAPKPLSDRQLFVMTFIAGFLAFSGFLA